MLGAITSKMVLPSRRKLMAGTLGAGDKAIFMAVVVSQLKVSLAEMTKRDLTAGAEVRNWLVQPGLEKRGQ